MNSSVSGDRSTEVNPAGGSLMQGDSVFCGIANPGRQSGITITGFLFFSVLIIAVAGLALKLGPAYAEFHAIQKVFRSIAADPGLRTANRGEINAAFNSRAAIEGIKSISYDDIEISRQGGDLVLSAVYSVRVPLFYHLSACMDFQPSSTVR